MINKNHEPKGFNCNLLLFSRQPGQLSGVGQGSKTLECGDFRTSRAATKHHGKLLIFIFLIIVILLIKFRGVGFWAVFFLNYLKKLIRLNLNNSSSHSMS
jgi:hypothetical protein